MSELAAEVAKKAWSVWYEKYKRVSCDFSCAWVLDPKHLSLFILLYRNWFHCVPISLINIVPILCEIAWVINSCVIVVIGVITILRMIVELRSYHITWSLKEPRGSNILVENLSCCGKGIELAGLFFFFYALSTFYAIVHVSEGGWESRFIFTRLDLYYLFNLSHPLGNWAQ